MEDKVVHVRGMNVHVELDGDRDLPVIVFLHGFTGSTATWRDICQLLEGKFYTVAVDLTGHGKTTVPVDHGRYSMEQQIEDLEAVFKVLGFDRFTLVGYSMGGRIALAYTVQFPDRVTSLVLESSSPGLRTEAERMARREADIGLANRILKDGISEFVNFWENIPLFNSQKKLSEEKQREIRAERLSQCETGLSNSLRAIGTGCQRSYWEEIDTVHLPTLLITGELDTKFVNISWEMKNHFPNVLHRTVENVGHAIHVEKPALFATMIEEHITSLKNGGGIV